MSMGSTSHADGLAGALQDPGARGDIGWAAAACMCSLHTLHHSTTSAAVASPAWLEPGSWCCPVQGHEVVWVILVGHFQLSTL